MNFKEIDCFAETFLLIVFATYATIFSFSISTKLSSFYVPTFLKCPTLPNNRALRIWYTIWQKIAAALAQNGRKRILGWASLYCWFRSLKFPFRPVHGLAYDILCLSALISSFVCVYTSLTCSLLDTTQLTVYSLFFRFWCFRLTFEQRFFSP